MNTSGKLKIAYSKIVDISKLTSEERLSLGDSCWNVFQPHFKNLDKGQVIEHLFFRSGEGKLFLCYNNEDQLVGFSSYRRLVIMLHGKKHVVLTIGMWSDLKYQGFGRRLLRAWVLQTVRYWLKSPLHPLFLAGFTTSPAPYRMVMQGTFTAYPRGNAQPPKVFVEVMEEVAKRNKMVPVAGRPLVFRESHLLVSHANADKQSASPTIYQDSTYPHYMRMNPDWAQGDMLATGIPLTMGNLVLTVLKRFFLRMGGKAPR